MAMRSAMPMFDLPPGTDRNAFLHAASPAGLGLVARLAASASRSHRRALGERAGG